MSRKNTDLKKSQELTEEIKKKFSKIENQSNLSEFKKNESDDRYESIVAGKDEESLKEDFKLPSENLEEDISYDFHIKKKICIKRHRKSKNFGSWLFSNREI